MKILYAISVLSFCLLVWAAIAIVRHIRRAPATPVNPSDPEIHPDLTSGPDPSTIRLQPTPGKSSTSRPSPPVSSNPGHNLS